MIRRTVRLLVLASAACLIAAPASHADRTAQLMFEDPTIAPGGFNNPAAAIPQWAALGAQWVRVQAYWDAASPQPTSQTRPAGFDVSNPNSPGYNWTSLDEAINRVRASGLRIMLSVNQFNPVWASTEPRRGQLGWKPSPRLFAQWTSALVRRYRGRIQAVALGNEANQGFLLKPQTSCTRYRVRGRFRVICERTSAHIYRNLVRAGYPAVKRIARIPVIIGEMAPIGGAGLRAGNVAPLPFIREMACVDSRYRRITIGACAGFRPARGDVFGYHFYQVRARPQGRTPNINSAKLGDIARLLGVLDRVTRTGRIIAPGRRFNLWADEYGYETCPPECRNGVSLRTQSRYLQESAYVVWRTPRVKMYAQYKWQDDPIPAQGFQTGLLFANGAAKPSLGSFPNPFFIDTRRPGRGRSTIWGQVRPGTRHTVQVFRNGALYFTARTDGLGYFASVRRIPRGSSLFYRYTFGGRTFTSDTLRV